MPLTMDAEKGTQGAEHGAPNDESTDALATVFIGAGAAGLLLIVGFWTLFFDVPYVAIAALGLAAMIALRTIRLALGEIRK